MEDFIMAFRRRRGFRGRRRGLRRARRVRIGYRF